MKKRWLIACAGIALVPLLPVGLRAQKLVFVVRHAERADSGAPAMKMETDPPLSNAGAERARKLAAMLVAAGIKAVYVTEYRRTRDTAAPLAKELGLEPQAISSRDPAALVEELRTRHGDDIVFVVGHSNTVPDIIKRLGGPAVTIGDSEYDNLFIVIPGTGTTTRVKFAP